MLADVCLVGSSKMFVPQEKLAAMGSSAQWVLEFSPGTLKAIGAVELLAAVGLILPAVLDIAPVLVPPAATGLCCSPARSPCVCAVARRPRSPST
ncbi:MULTISPECIES: DoxX family protein [Streptomyces]|uniref:DoxX family protein n=1 Tax=Streptomyces doebereineriae TaxID=3075528 RepID=A0ABU2VH03_9ACTN|nr:DoxX family protein [Streptomyces sp. DSM 41640]MDT0484588.1 DoxX family protein [Streptomyces sp. DSM 41640]